MSNFLKNGLAAHFLLLLLVLLLTLPANPQAGGTLPLTSAGCGTNKLSCFWANSTGSCYVSVTDYTTGTFACYPQTTYPENRCIKQTIVVRKGTDYCQAYVEVECCDSPYISVSSSTTCGPSGQATPTETEFTDVSYSYTCC